MYISRDGDLKAQSFFNSSNNRLCADLVQGNSATVSVGGTSVTDYTANGASVCTYTGTSDSNTYNMHLVWQGTSGAILTNDRPVQGQAWLPSSP